MHYPQLQEQHHTLASESINYIPIEKKKNLKHHNVAPSAYPVSAKGTLCAENTPSLTERA